MSLELPAFLVRQPDRRRGVLDESRLFSYNFPLIEKKVTIELVITLGLAIRY